MLQRVHKSKSRYYATWCDIDRFDGEATVNCYLPYCFNAF